MKNTHKKFLSLLAAEIGQDEKITSIHLNGLISEIINTVEEGRSYTITGFGTFLKDGPELLFEPDSRLAAEINYNYEGMVPIDVNEAKSVVDDEPVEKPSRPTRKTDTLIVDEEVAGEEDPFGLPDEEAATPSVLLSGADEDEERTQTKVAQTDGTDSVDEIDPFETDTAAESGDTGLTSSDQADVNEPFETDAAAESGDIGLTSSDQADVNDPFETDAAAESGDTGLTSSDQADEPEGLSDSAVTDSPGPVKKGIVFEFDEEAGVLESGDENIEAVQDTAADEAADAIPSAPGSDDAGREDDSTRKGPLTGDLSGSDLSDLDDILGSENPANLDDSDDLIGSAGLDEEETLADAAASKTVSKPEPVIKVGNIAGKRTPGAESGVKAASGGQEGEESSAPAKTRPLPGDRKNGQSSTTLIAAAVALVAVIFGVWWFFLRDSGADVAASAPVAVTTPPARQNETAVNDGAAESESAGEQDEGEPMQVSAENPDQDGAAMQAGTGVSGDITSSTEQNTGAVSTTGDVAEDNALGQAETNPAAADVTDWQQPRPVGSPVDSDDNLSDQQGEVSPFGLRGTAQPMNGRVFSIVVHSLPNRIDGNAQCDEIARLRLRCVVVEATVNGRITYRVGIGQFETYAEARERVSELPEPYRSRNFPARIN